MYLSIFIINDQRSHRHRAIRNLLNETKDKKKQQQPSWLRSVTISFGFLLLLFLLHWMRCVLLLLLMIMIFHWNETKQQKCQREKEKRTHTYRTASIKELKWNCAKRSMIFIVLFACLLAWKSERSDMRMNIKSTWEHIREEWREIKSKKKEIWKMSSIGPRERTHSIICHW